MVIDIVPRQHVLRQVRGTADLTQTALLAARAGERTIHRELGGRVEEGQGIARFQAAVTCDSDLACAAFGVLTCGVRGVDVQLDGGKTGVVHAEEGTLGLSVGSCRGLDSAPVWGRDGVVGGDVAEVFAGFQVDFGMERESRGAVAVFGLVLEAVNGQRVVAFRCGVSIDQG